MLAGLPADVDFQADLQWRQGGGALGGQPLGDLQPVDAVHPVEVLGHRARLVALQGPDEVPGDRFGAVAQVGQGAGLGGAFLHVVLAEQALPGGMGGAYGVGVEGLGNGQ